jgi:hypothetical protein
MPAKSTHQLSRLATSVRSPDLNPIDRVFAKQHLLRKAAARSAETICVAIGEILRVSTPTNAPSET